MDSTENVIALPANMATFLAAPNSRLLPIHRGSHAFMYDADAAGLMATLVLPNAVGAPNALHASLLAVERRMEGRAVRRHLPRQGALSMPKLWLAGASATSLQATLDLQDASPSRFQVVERARRPRRAGAYRRGISRARDGGGRAAGVQGDAVPRLRDHGSRLPLRLPRVRDRLRLAPSPCRPRPPGQRGDQFDHDRTPGRTETVALADGRTMEPWRPARPLPGRESTITWRADFVAPAPLFRVFGTSWTLATEALAKRAMDAGITDLVFQDVEGTKAPGEITYRLR